MKINQATIENTINESGYILQTVVGRSMYPMLRDKKDNVLIEKPTFPLKKYAVPLYKSQDGRYILHRIIKIKNGEYIIRGDNTYEKEYGVKDENIVGVLTAFYRGKKYVKVTNFGYKLYVRLNIFFYPLRYIYFRCKCLAHKIYHALFKKNKKHQ